jgi:hypothetical protein
MKKICSKCKKQKDISEFPKNKKTKLGIDSWCEICHRNIDKEYQRNKRKLGLVNKTEEYRIWRKTHRKECNAEQLTNYYIRIGKIKKEKCKICKKKNAYAHHDNYDKPLEIRWMCPSCHKKFHLGILVEISKIIN